MFPVLATKVPASVTACALYCAASRPAALTRPAAPLSDERSWAWRRNGRRARSAGATSWRRWSAIPHSRSGSRAWARFRRRKKRERRCSRPWSGWEERLEARTRKLAEAKVSEMGRALRPGRRVDEPRYPGARQASRELDRERQADRRRQAPRRRRNAERRAHGKTVTARSATGPGHVSPGRGDGGPRRDARSTSRPRRPALGSVRWTGLVPSPVVMARPPL